MNNTNQQESITYPAAFSGSGSEYFKIWIVNVALTILTLGIYSAWAKVRTKRYFYANTTIDNSPFEYTGKPLSILMGRLVALAVLCIVVAGTQLPSLQLQAAFWLLCGLAAIPVFPWLMIASLSFNARHTRYRNVPFRFVGDYSQGLKTWFMAKLQALSYTAMFKAAAFRVNNCRYGETRFELHGNGLGIFKPRANAAGIFFLVLVTTSIALSVIGINPMGLPFGAAAIAAYTYKWVHAKNYQWNHTRLEECTFESTMTYGGFLKLSLSNLALTFLTLGLYYPWAKVNITRYRCANFALHSPRSLDTYVAVAPRHANVIGSEVAEITGTEFGI